MAGPDHAGVHARGQVASFVDRREIPGDLTRRLNGIGPRDLAMVATAAADGFDARADATLAQRTATARSPAAPTSPFERGRALWWPHRIDREGLRACAASLIGRHDFTAFTPTRTDHVHFDREVSRAAWVPRGDILAFEITADAFMRNMVRILVGTMLEVASDRRTVESFTSLLAGAPSSQAGETAPPHGLYLESVSLRRDRAAREAFAQTD